VPSRMEQIRAGFDLVRLAWRADRRLSLATIALAVLDVAQELGVIVLTGLVVGAVPDLDRLVPLLVALAVVQVPPVGELRWRLLWSLSARVRIELEARIHTSLATPPGIAHLEDPVVQDEASKAVTFWNSSVLEGTVNVALVRVNGFVAAVLVATWSVPAALGLAVVWHVFGRYSWRRATGHTSVLFNESEGLRRAEYEGELGLLPEAAKEVRVFGLRDWVAARFVDRWWTAMTPVWRERRRSWPAGVVLCVLLFAANAAALALLGRNAIAGEVGLGVVAIVVQAVAAMSALGQVPFGQYEVAHGLRTVTANGNLERMVTDDRFVMTGERRLDDAPRDTVRLEAVTFAYPDAPLVLDGVDLELPAGSSLAIVGPNGAGKTTLVKLLCRFYDPGGGRITVDGVDLRDLDPRWWHHRIAALFQGFLRYPLTVADNIAYAAEPDRERLVSASERAGATAAIERLPSGYDTPLTRTVEGGADLSGGEWQRIALARALYALDAGAGVLVLDEPAAHLDARAEADLYDRFLRLTHGVTTVVISHRFSTVRHADRIVVLDAGHLVESGTHGELVDAGGVYARMFRLQAERFDA